MNVGNNIVNKSILLKKSMRKNIFSKKRTKNRIEYSLKT